MIKKLVDLTELEKLNMLIDGTSYAMFEAHLDKEAYEKSKGTYGRFDDAVKYIDPRKE